MGSMTDERRKEMEEEMMRFEQEIFTSLPGEKEDGSTARSNAKQVTGSKLDDSKKPKLAPPPPPPVIRDILPKVLAEPPPPPPTSESALAPPPMPPHLRESEERGGDHMQFIPHQIQRPPPQPNFQMSGPPAFSQPPMPPPFSSMGGPMPGPPMAGPMPCGPMAMPPMPMPPMGMPMSMIPPGFIPPAVHNIPPQPFIMPEIQVQYEEPIQSEPEIQEEVEIDPTPAPAIYAAPPMKHERIIEIITPSNGYPVETTIANSRPEEPVLIPKPMFEPIIRTNMAGPVVPDTLVSRKKEKKKKIVRMAGGQAWEDNSLLDWDPDDFRIFCGDLGNDVTDEVLIRSFSKYPSFVKAKVIRDKRTNKTKGYGFVSFKDPQDFIKAMKEMNGRYVGSRPIKLRKSTWKDRNIEIVRKKQREKEKLGLL